MAKSLKPKRRAITEWPPEKDEQFRMTVWTDVHVDGRGVLQGHICILRFVVEPEAAA